MDMPSGLDFGTCLNPKPQAQALNPEPSKF